VPQTRIDEQIVLVSEAGEPIGSTPKLASHHAHTPLHRGFSVYIFNDRGQILVTQRALTKKVWPSVWTNSCCGHPMPGESTPEAIKRRVSYELGMTVDNLQSILPNYRYTTPPYQGIIENEVCPVYFARSNDTPDPNPEQVEDYKWLSWEEFRTEASNDQGDTWSWWCKDQLKQLPSDPKKYSTKN